MAVRKMSRHMHVRLTADQHAKVRRAAQLESERAGVRIEESTVFRAEAMKGIERILADAPRTQAVA